MWSSGLEWHLWKENQGNAFLLDADHLPNPAHSLVRSSRGPESFPFPAQAKVLSLASVHTAVTASSCLPWKPFGTCPTPFPNGCGFSIAQPFPSANRFLHRMLSSASSPATGCCHLLLPLCPYHHRSPDNHQVIGLRSLGLLAFFSSIFQNVTHSHWINRRILWILVIKNIESDFCSIIALLKNWYSQTHVTGNIFLMAALSLLLKVHPSHDTAVPHGRTYRGRIYILSLPDSSVSFLTRPPPPPPHSGHIWNPVWLSKHILSFLKSVCICRWTLSA